MDVLQAVLDYETPDTWVSRCPSQYNDSFLLFQIYENSDEWCNAVGHSTYEGDVVLLERVQNPFQLGLFRIQEEKRSSEGEDHDKILGYHVVHPSDKERALKFPLDYRRYQHKRPHLQYSDKHPKFYHNLGSAFEAGRHELSSNGEVVVILCDRYSNVKNQGDYCPKYVITLNTNT